MDINSILSWIIAGVALLAVYALSEKKRFGWILYLIGQILSMVLYYRTGLWGLFWVNIVFAYLSVRGYRNWDMVR